MTNGYIFTATSFISAVVILCVMGLAWVAVQLVKGFRAIDKRIDRILDGCL